MKTVRAVTPCLVLVYPYGEIFPGSDKSDILTLFVTAAFIEVPPPALTPTGAED